jgi:methionine-rich copper-binding protein CopC
MALGALGLVLGAFAAPVAAHSEVEGFSPAPGQDVGGVVDRVEIRFFTPVTDAVVLVEAPDGATITGTTELVDDFLVRFEMAALDQPGEHIVTWRAQSVDGDGQEAAYAFTFDPDAPPLDDGGAGAPGRLTVGIAVGIVGVGGAGFLALMRRTGRRRAG